MARRRGLSMRKMMLVMLLGVLAFSALVVRADETLEVDQARGVEDQIDQEISEEEIKKKQEAEKQAAQLIKEQRKKAALVKKRKMESCLTLVRTFYSSQEKVVSEFVEMHPTKDKGRLLNKILSQMMLKCNAEISEDQIEVLQGYKQNAVAFNHESEGYLALIEIAWEDLMVEQGEDEDDSTGPVEMTQEEILMSNEMEDYSDELKREQDLEMKASLGRTQIAFFDIDSMGTISSLFYLLAIAACFAGVVYWFWLELNPNQQDDNTLRRQKILERRQKQQ